MFLKSPASRYQQCHIYDKSLEFQSFRSTRQTLFTFIPFLNAKNPWNRTDVSGDRFKSSGPVLRLFISSFHMAGKAVTVNITIYGKKNWRWQEVVVKTANLTESSPPSFGQQYMLQHFYTQAPSQTNEVRLYIIRKRNKSSCLPCGQLSAIGGLTVQTRRNSWSLFLKMRHTCGVDGVQKTFLSRVFQKDCSQKFSLYHQKKKG